MKKYKSLKVALLFTALTGIGMNFHHPVTPTLFTELGLPARVFGNSFAVMCFFSFLTSPFWGEISNRVGRVKVFFVTCIAYGIGQFLLGEVTTEMGVYAARMLSGLFTGGASIANMVYIIDISTDEEKSYNMALYTAILTVSSAFGYLFGGLLGTYIGYDINFVIQAIWMIAIGILSLIFQEESLQFNEASDVMTLVKKANPFSAFVKAGSLLNSITWFFFLTVALTGFASACYDNAFNYYLKDQLNFLPAFNGVLKAAIGIIGLVANFTITLWIMRKQHLPRSLSIILLLCAIATSLGLINAGLGYFVVINLVFYTVNSIYQPIQRAISVEGRSLQDAGITAGLYSSMSNVGNVFGGIAAGWVYGFNAQSPFVLAAVVFLFAAASNYIYYRKNKNLG